MTNREALTLALAKLGEVEGLEAEVQAAFTIADELDAGNPLPEMLREYRMILRVIREAVVVEDEPDAFDEWMRAQMGDTSDGEAESRSAVGGDR